MTNPRKPRVVKKAPAEPPQRFQPQRDHVLQHPRASGARILASQLQLAEHAREHFRATPPHGVKPEHVLNPEYWTHVAARLRPLAIIEVVPEDCSYFMELLVVSCNRLQARVQQLRLVEVDPPAPEEMETHLDPAYDVKYGGPTARWRVMRRSDSKIVRDGFDTEGEARAFLVDYIRALAA